MDKQNQQNQQNNENSLAQTFINGLIVLIPLAIAVLVIGEIFHFTEGVLGKHLPFYFPGIGLIALLILIYVSGWISTHWLLKKIIHFGEYLLGKIPIVKFVYSSVKQFSTAIFESKSTFQDVVLAPFNQSMILGFLMADIPATIKSELGEEYVCVFVPWSLNVTSGMNLFVKRSEIVRVNMTSEEALQYILTAGAVNHKIKS